MSRRPSSRLNPLDAPGESIARERRRISKSSIGPMYWRYLIEHTFASKRSEQDPDVLSAAFRQRDDDPVTLLVTFYTSNGIVFTADSAITQPQGSRVTPYSKQTKILPGIQQIRLIQTSPDANL
jgi:hypothetical protein